MWWMEKQSRSVQPLRFRKVNLRLDGVPNAALTSSPTVPNSAKVEPSASAEASQSTTPPTAVTPTAEKPTAGPTRNPPKKRRRPLVDNLTPAQNEANKIMADIDCGHDVEIAQLRHDVESLESAVRQCAAISDQQQAKIEAKESQLRNAEAKAEMLENTVAEFDNELDRLQIAMQMQGEQQFAEQLQFEEQVDDCEQRLLASESRLIKYGHAIERDELERQDDRDAYEEKIRANTEALTTIDQQSSLWQREAHRYRSRFERLKLQTIRNDAEISQAREAQFISETKHQWKDAQIAELLPLQDLLSDAQGRVENWQAETRRSEVAKRSLSEQLERLKAVADEKEATLQRELVQAESVIADQNRIVHQGLQKLHVFKLRAERLEADRRHRDVAIRSLYIQMRRQRNNRDSEVGTAQRSSAFHAEKLAAHESTLRQKDAELSIAWKSTEEATTKLHLQKLALDRACENENRIVELQTEQFRSLNNRIDDLVNQLDDAEKSLLQSSQHNGDLLATRDKEIERLTDELARTIEQLTEAERSNAEQRQLSSKLRAQLSGGKARGSLLVDRYHERLGKAKQAIATLRGQRDKLLSMLQAKHPADRSENQKEHATLAAELQRCQEELKSQEATLSDIREQQNHRAA